MKFGIYPGGRAGMVCSHPPDVAAIRHLVDDLSGGHPFVIREYVHFFGDATPADVVTSLGAEHELAHLTMPDEWYVEGNRELDLVVSYIPRAADVSGWLAFLDTVIDRYGHLARYLQVTLEPNFPIPLIDGSAPGVLEALTLGILTGTLTAAPRNPPGRWASSPTPTGPSPLSRSTATSSAALASPPRPDNRECGGPNRSVSPDYTSTLLDWIGERISHRRR